jgi:lipoprotein-anchoring transpeptidase ErfK/SrfK
MSRFNLSAAAISIATVFTSTAAFGGPLGYAPWSQPQSSIFEQVSRDSVTVEDQQQAAEIPARLRRQMVAYQTREAPGSIVIDTPNTQLYYVLGGGRAIRYGIGVGRDGFTWSGVQTIVRKSEWPDWHPPQEMIERQPYLPRFMAGGPGNPLGARAMYLGGTIYRIHGTNAPDTIGGQVSSGCIRMLNEDVIDLYARVNVGTKVVVLPANPRLGSNLSVRGRSISDARPATASNSTARVFGIY